MPVFYHERVPLPSLKVYIALTGALQSCALYYTLKSVSDSTWKLNSTYQWNFKILDSPFTTIKLYDSYVNLSDVLSFMVQDPFCLGTLMNSGYCGLFLLGKIVQKLVFGDLRVSESQHIKDKLWNFIFYKFIFIFGVINVQYIDEVLMWCVWFTIIGSFHVLAQLCKDRFEYLSFSATNPAWSHFPLLALLGLLMVCSTGMLSIAIVVGMNWGLNSFAFMGAECIQLIVCLVHTLLRYVLHLYEIRGDMTGPIWEKRGSLAYYIELCLELLALLIELAHHLHMLLWSNIFLSMASLVIGMHIRFLVEEMRRRIRKHRNYLWVLYHMEQSYPMATSKELSENSDNCAICWEVMESARKLPCSHLFHSGCLQSWLEQETSCPTCRMTLSINNRDPHNFNPDHPQHNRQRPNHFFHFDGSRYVSWLPSFSVEVIHTQLIRQNNLQMNHNSQLDAMGRQVQQLFQNYPLSTIISDLQVTRSVEMTVGNILDGRLPVPNNEAFLNSVSLQTQPTLMSNSLVQHDWNEAVSENESNQGLERDPSGETFSDSPTEREKNLNLRKEKMIMTARRRYLEKHPSRYS